VGGVAGTTTASLIYSAATLIYRTAIDCIYTYIHVHLSTYALSLSLSLSLSLAHTHTHFTHRAVGGAGGMTAASLIYRTAINRILALPKAKRCAKEPIFFAKEPILSTKEPIFFTKEPIFSTKEPIFFT